MVLGGCVLVILPITWGGVGFAWNSAEVIAPLVSGVFLLAVLCVWEWRGASLPIIPSTLPSPRPFERPAEGAPQCTSSRSKPSLECAPPIIFPVAGLLIS